MAAAKRVATEDGVELVVGFVGGQGEFTDRHAQRRRNAHLAAILNRPPALFKLPVN